ncbi:hypothetical protein AAFP30_16130 [Gordonia sp. CPCC 205515]|uniref:hypothetical protein n=1 Tax=Gordonia sp. CPCC 205515 TaxID=3140791 RepID=UPI003AF35263
MRRDQIERILDDFDALGRSEDNSFSHAMHLALMIEDVFDMRLTEFELLTLPDTDRSTLIDLIERTSGRRA